MNFKSKYFALFASIIFGVFAAPLYAFDAGTTDPNLREFDRLVNDNGDDCRIEVGYLQVSAQLTQLLIITNRTSSYDQYHYNGGSYDYRGGGYSQNEADYNLVNSGTNVDGALAASIGQIEQDCGWDVGSASFTDLTPSSVFGIGTFAQADSAGFELSYTYDDRSFAAVGQITGGANSVPTVSSVYTGTPDAPSSLAVTPIDGGVTVTFTAPSDLPSGAGEGDNAITNYQFSSDNGVNWNSLSPVDNASPVTITGLVNGNSYNLRLRAVNGVGAGKASTAVTAAPNGVDTTAPTLASSAPADGATYVALDTNIVLTFTEAVDTVMGNITLYNSADVPVETFDVASSSAIAGSGTTTITIDPTSDLDYSTGYYVQIDAAALQDASGNIYAGIADTATLNFTTVAAPDPTAPTFDVAAAVGSVTSTGFTPSASIDEGGTIYYVVVADGATAPSASQVKAGNDASGSSALAAANAAVSSSPFDSSFAAITSLSAGTAYDVYFIAEDDEGTPNVQSAVTKVDTTTTVANSPALEFAEHEDDIRQSIASDAQRNLRATLTANANVARDARSRFIESKSITSAGIGNIAFDVDGVARFSGGVFNTNGSFFELLATEYNQKQRLFFGDFSLQRDADASVTASFSAKMAWERIVSDDALYGYFIGGQFAQSDMKGDLSGDNERIGLEAGAYTVQQLGETLYFDGFASVGLNHNQLELADDVLSLTSDYRTKNLALGAILSGIITKKSYQLRPELALNFGKTWIGDVGFTGVAYGMTDDTLSLNAGQAILGSVTLRPEVAISMDGRAPEYSNSEMSFSPRFVCEHVKTSGSNDYCGAGAELGFSSISEDGLSSADVKLIMDRIDNGTRSSVQFGIEHRF